MKFKKLNGEIISIQLRKKALCRQVTNRSKGQTNLSTLLKEIYGPVEIFEEFIIPGERLSLDFFIPKRKIAFEFHGKQHYNINRFFHKNKQDFLNQKNRDARKAEWCRINQIILVEVNSSHMTVEGLRGLVADQIRKQSNY